MMAQAARHAGLYLVPVLRRISEADQPAQPAVYSQQQEARGQHKWCSAWRSTELARPRGEPPAEKREADGGSSASDDAGIPDEAANPAGIRTDGAPTRAACRGRSQARYHVHC